MDNIAQLECFPVDAENISGDNLEYDPSYLQLEELAAAVPAHQMGDSIVEGRDPDWRTLRKQCRELWTRTRDLRVAAYYAVAGLALDGLDGFAAGLDTVRGLLADQWDTFWPRLDPDDGSDPLERLNIIAMISPPPGAFDDPLHFLDLFREVRLVPSGPAYTLRDLMIADGELDSGDVRPDSALLHAEMTAVPYEVMRDRNALVERIQKTLAEIGEIFAARTDNYPLSFATLQEELKRLKRFYGGFAAEPAALRTSGDPDAAEEDAPLAGAAVSGDPVAVAARSRREAIRLLRKGCEYFQKAEPTSPVPFLINRAIRMADMNFMDLLAEIDSNAVERGRDILGVKTTENESES